MKKKSLQFCITASEIIENVAGFEPCGVFVESSSSITVV